MAVFSKVATTTLGLNLYAKVQAGAALNFTRMQIGGGQLPAGNDPAAQTALITPIAYFAINSISSNLNTAHIKGIFENTLINVDTYTCELGLFATDPDLGEILYAYANALAQGDTIPPISSGPLSKQFQMNAAIGNSTSVTATIPAGTYIPMSDKGIANGVATLDATIKIPLAQLPLNIPAANLANGAATDTVIGNRTIDDTVTPNTGPNTITNLFSMIGKMLRLFSGESSWITSPRTTLKNAVKLSGDVMTGILTLFANPVGAFDAVTKQYNDSFVNTSPAPTALNPVYGTQIATATKASPFNVINICGCTRINGMGKDGGEEAIGKSVLSATTETLDTANKDTGLASVKNTASGGNVEHYASFPAVGTYPININSYYVLLGMAKPNIGQAVLRAVITGGTAPFTNIVTDTTKFNLSSVKFSSGALTSVSIRTQVLNATGTAVFTPAGSAENANFDSIRLIEVSLADYNAFDALTDAQKIAKYPYVDDVKHVNGVYINRIGENMLPTFNEYTLSANATVIEPYNLTHVATANNESDYVDVPVVVGQIYSAAWVGNLKVSFQSLDANKANVGSASAYAISPLTYTAPTGASYVRVYFGNSTLGAGTYTATNPRFNITADKGFKPRNDDYLFFPNTAIASSVDGTVFDQIFRRDGKFFRENRFVRDFVLDGSLPWVYAGPITGSKLVSYALPSAPVTDTAVVVKYDGKVLSRVLTANYPPTTFDQIVNNATLLYITINNTEAGFDVAFSPSVGEIQAYFYGWKMNNGTFGTPYNGTGTKTWTLWNATNNTGSATVLPTTLATGFTPYKLSYQLSNSYSEEIPFEGSISTLEGSNQFEVGNGMIVREKANPVIRVSDGKVAINLNDALAHNFPKGSQLKNRINKPINIYKNGKIDYSWTALPDSWANGNLLITTSLPSYDLTATYEVTYLILDEYLLSANVQTINGEYDTNVKMVVDRLAQNQADIDTRVSVSENPSTILTRLKTVDGVGSGLDADLLDGLDSLAFVKADGSVPISGSLSVAGSLTAGAGGSFANSKAANGYQKLPGGLIIQWVAQTSVTLNGGVQTTITFPIPFPNAVTVVTPAIAGSLDARLAVSASNVNNCSIIANSAAGGTVFVSIIAIGY